MSGGITDLSSTPAPASLTVDVCVVGSGPGGSTAARALARAGRDVLVLDEGGDRTGAQLTRRDGEMYDQLYVDRGGRSTSDLSISVLQGRALGGGAVINACDVAPIPDGVLRHWRERFGLSGFDVATVARYRKQSLGDLSASRPLDAQVNRNNRIVMEGTEALGWKGEFMWHNRIGCAGLGACLLGCPLNAKRNPRFVAIPQAIEAGARFFIRARVVRIDDSDKDIKQLRVRRIDSKGYHESDEFTVRAKTVIVAANAVGSAALLVRSGIGNAHVGRNLMLQPQLPITALFDEPVRLYEGIPQIYAVTEFEDKQSAEHGWWGFRIEPVGGTPGIVSTIGPAVGAAAKTWMTKYPYLAASLLLLPDGPNGWVEVEPSGRLRVHYEMPAEQVQRYRDASKAAARIYLTAGARKVVIPSIPPTTVTSVSDLTPIDRMSFRPASVPLISAHQQGSVRMSPSAKTGAADPDGAVYGARGVYVFDSSGFPSSASSHTMTPITTVSALLTARLLASSG